MKVAKIFIGIAIAFCLMGVLVAVFAPKPTPTATETPKQKEELKYSIERKGDGVADDVVKQAVIIFQEICQPLMGKYVDDVEGVFVTVYRQYPGDYVYDYYGWGNQIEISIKIKDDPSLIPSSYEAWGQTLSFVLGGGAHPGYFTFKRPKLCGLQEVTPKANVFSSVPELSIIGD